MAAGNAIGFAEDLQSFRGGFVAAIEDEAVRGHQRGWSKVAFVAPVGGAGGGTGTA